MAKIFISHSHADNRLASRLHGFLNEISANKFDVQRSSDISAIPTGTSWKKWIDENIATCDVAIVLLTESSVRGRWVMWEAGAVAGVQYYRDRPEAMAQPPGNPNSGHGRVRVLNFGIPTTDMGPFAGDQTKDGRSVEAVSEFAAELLDTFKQELGATHSKALRQVDEKAKTFVEKALDDLRFTPIPATEPLVQNWLSQLDDALAKKNYHWVASAKRWINIAFLGVGNADACEPTDFRIHLRLAKAFEEIKNRDEAIQQLNLARRLSPNDMIIHRTLGKLYRKYNATALKQTLACMEEMDPQVFTEDREAIALKVGDLFDLGCYDQVVKLLNEANQAVIADDAYLLNWRALATLKDGSIELARKRFAAIEARLGPNPTNFWDQATRVNALIARSAQTEVSEVINALEKLAEYKESKENLRSAAKYFDEISAAAGLAVPWRKILAIADDA
jgi:tetratricopeptide (TPR) repeat protein